MRYYIILLAVALSACAQRETSDQLFCDVAKETVFSAGDTPTPETRAKVLADNAKVRACSSSRRALYCAAASPTYLLKEDRFTPATQRKIIGDNEVGARLCGWKPANRRKT